MRHRPQGEPDPGLSATPGSVRLMELRPGRGPANPPPRPRPWGGVSVAAMAAIDQDDATIYAVVVNHEEQYSIWAADRPLPAGWHEEGTRGSRAECLEHIAEVWTDMRPLS